MSVDESRDITGILQQVSRGDRDAYEQLMPLVYDELKRLARGKLRLERKSHTLNTTALVHEAYLKLVDQDRVEWQSRSHFFAVAAQAMRRILIDYAKMRRAARRGGGAPHVPLDTADDLRPGDSPLSDEQAVELITLDQALQRLAEFNLRGADVVQYRFFGGLSYGEISEVLGVSEITVRRAWMGAKAWLSRELGDDFSFG